MQLSEVISGLEAVSIEGRLDREVVGIALDYRSVFPGMVFVAVPGRRADGHEHISSAIDRGACAVICQKSAVVSRRATRITVPDTRVALGLAAAAFYGHPSARLRVIGVTGTDGKTVVSFLVRNILEAAGWPTGMTGSVRYEIGDRTMPAQRTTPEAVELQSLMSQMERKGCENCVLEVSSHALVQKRVDAVEFDLGIFTNLGQEHLDYHGTPEAYFRAKRRLFELMEAGSKAAGMVVNADDSSGLRLLQECQLGNRWTYGLGAGASVRGRRLEVGPRGTRMVLETGQGSFETLLPLVGRFNVYNLLAAVAASQALRRWTAGSLSMCWSIMRIPKRH
jgi:UDP-N-acetylmuramoyl-L-alanyl-D-glutamate--2,6-diaminopimelate ligase